MQRPVNVCVKPREGESQEGMVKRFFKKCKKQEIIKEYLEKTSYFRNNRTKRLEKIERNKYRKNQ